jgi:hypothetical protein
MKPLIQRDRCFTQDLGRQVASSKVVVSIKEVVRIV